MAPRSSQRRCYSGRRSDPVRLWSLHPKYLDSQGLVALWREALLAQSVLQGNTRGYLKHPQLERFRSQPEPRLAICAYLQGVLGEATARGYAFDENKIGLSGEHPCAPIAVSVGQLEYEWQHLQGKLSIRNPKWHEKGRAIGVPHCHPLFRVSPGEIESWERPPGHWKRLPM